MTSEKNHKFKMKRINVLKIYEIDYIFCGESFVRISKRMILNEG